jgi:hypothetical protein
MYIAMVVRNAMEDFHCRNLSDDQMAELNPIIRNAICTALHAAERGAKSPGAAAFVAFHQRSIPKYWEQPVLLEDFVAMESMLEAKPRWDGSCGGGAPRSPRPTAVPTCPS